MAAGRDYALPDLTSQPANAEAYYNFLKNLYDSLIGRAVVSSTVAAQPGSPAEEDAYIIATGASGTAWTGNSGKLAVFINGSWSIFTAKEGWRFWDQANNKRVRFDGTNWIDEAQTKTISILNPTITENITIAYFKRAVTIRRVNAVMRGTSPSRSIQLPHGTDRSAAGANLFSSAQAITNVTTGQELTTFADATLGIGEFLWLLTSGGPGTTNLELHLTIEYTED